MKDRATPQNLPPSASVVSGGPVVGAASWWWVAAVLAAAFAAYWPALSGAFIWDDDGHLTRPELRSLGGLARIWFELGATQQYYPVLHSVFWLEHLVFGEAATAYHAINILLHATAACLFATVLRRLQVPGAWLAAFLFLLHPVGVESVAWISEQKNTLSLVFYLLAALAYVRFDRDRRLAWYALATVLFLFALGSKTVTASLPAALLVVFWWQRGRLAWRGDIMPLLPWFALSLVAGLTTAWVEHAIINRGYAHELDPVQRVLLAGRAIWFYLGKLVFPANLVFVYPRWTIAVGAWWQYLFPLGLLLLALAGWRWRRHRGLVAGGLFFAGSLFPALGFVNVYPFVFSFVADHFQYLASLGIFALAGAGLARGLAWRPAGSASLLVLALLLSLGAQTWRQSTQYRNNLTLYESTLAKNPAAAMAHHNLAQHLIDLGRTADALPHLQAAIELQPNSAKAAYNFGHALLMLRDAERAIPHLERAVRLAPEEILIHNDLGLALMNLNRLEAAEAHFAFVLRLKPDHAGAHFNLALVLARRKEAARAVEHFAAAARLLPDRPETEFNWARTLMTLEKVGEALRHFERAARLAPERTDIQNLFARARAVGEQLEIAIARHRERLARDPGSAEAHLDLGEALQKAGREEEAAPHLAEAVRLGGKK